MDTIGNRSKVYMMFSDKASRERSSNPRTMELTWITSTDSDSRRRAKSHASREVQRRKASQSARRDRARQLATKPVLVAAPAKSLQLGGLELVPSPKSILGAGRVDPFANYPVRLKSDEQLELADHCKHSISCPASKLFVT